MNPIQIFRVESEGLKGTIIPLQNSQSKLVITQESPPHTYGTDEANNSY